MNLLRINIYFKIYDNNKINLIKEKNYSKVCLLTLNKNYNAFNIYSINLSYIGNLSQLLGCVITEIDDIK